MTATLSACPLLIVEDDPEMLEILTMRFHRLGFAVTSVSRPSEALEAAEQSRFSVALVDRSLPEQNGIWLMERLNSRTAGLRTIVLSGYADRIYEEEALGRGAYAYLRKPCPLAEVEATIRRAVADQLECECETSAG